jgi:hypothetical protein
MEEIVSREQEALASLTRQNDKTSGVWTLDILRDASLDLCSAEKRKMQKLQKQNMNYWRDEIDVLFTQSPLGKTALETVTGIFHMTMQAFVNVQKIELQSVLTYVVCRT